MSKVKIVSKNDIISDILEVAKRIKSIPSREEYREFGNFASSTAEARLGSWGVVSEKLKATNFVWR